MFVVYVGADNWHRRYVFREREDAVRWQQLAEYFWGCIAVIL